MKYFVFISGILFCSFTYGQAQQGPPPPRKGGTIEGSSGLYYMVDSMPEYPGGEEALMKFIQTNIHYPDMERQSNITGRVMVAFTINEDGSLSSIIIKRGVNEGLDAEALRVVSLLPKFKPGKLKGQAVKVNMVIPIMFRLVTPEQNNKDENK